MQLQKLLQLLVACTLVFYFPQYLAANSETTSNTPTDNELPQNKNLTVDDLHKKYPEAEIKQVPYEELQNIKNNGYYNECGSGGSYDTKTHTTNPSSPNNERGAYLNFNTFPNFNGGDGGKDFLIIVAVVGVLVVAFLVVYSVGYIYQSASAKLKCITWKDFGFRASLIDDRNQTQFRSGYMHGLYYSTGYRVPVGVMGLTVELGEHSFDLTIHRNTNATSSKTNNLSDISQGYKGTYLLVGPSFTIPFTSLNQHLFQIELLAGTSNNKDIGLLSTLRFGLVFRLSSQLNIGFNAGAALINIKGYRNYLNDSDQLNSLFGSSISFKW